MESTLKFQEIQMEFFLWKTQILLIAFMIFKFQWIYQHLDTQMIGTMLRVIGVFKEFFKLQFLKNLAIYT